MAGKCYVFTKNSQMTSIGAIFTSICHTKQLSPWPNSSASRVVNHSQLSACQEKMGSFEDHPRTHGYQTGLRTALSENRLFNLKQYLNTCAVGPLMQLSNGNEKCVLKLCVYKTPFGKSGHT